jgi:hypothetical protein
MKNIITLILFLSIYSCGDSTPEAITDSAAVIANEVSPTNNIIGIPIVIGSLEVAEKDFPNEMNWQSAKNACSNLGDGWRLPSNDELIVLYRNKSKIGILSDELYWSSFQDGMNDAWYTAMNDGAQSSRNKVSIIKVRAVRNSVKSESVKSESVISQTKEIGSLEVAEKDFPNEMNWQSAKNACSNLGKGWRLPTNDELNLLFQNKDNIGGFISSSYWSSVQNDDEYAWGWYFGDGKMEEYKKDVKLYVRAVKTKK